MTLYAFKVAQKLFVVLSGALIFGCTSIDQSQDTRPNILLIMADDMGYSDLGCYGGEINTPNLDRLAKGGVRFTQFYNNARCTPTRASLMTGLYPHQTGIGLMNRDMGYDGYRGDLSNKSVTIAEVLKGAGYKTYLSGKWHLTSYMEGDTKHNWPLQRGFDRFYGSLNGFGLSGYYHTATLTNDNESLPVPVNDFYYTDVLTDSAIAMINNHSSQESDPFFMYLAYTAPHWPLQALEEDIRKYDQVYDEGWDVIRKERLDRAIKEGIFDAETKLSERESEIPNWTNTKDKAWEVSRMQVHAAMVDRMDQGIGRVLETLQQQGKLENTLIFFLSDNGASAEEIANRGWWAENIPTATPDGRKIHGFNLPGTTPGADTTFLSLGRSWTSVSNSPFRFYKRYLYEGGTATPLIAHWPGGITSRNETRTQISHVIDIMATCVDVAKAAYPEAYNEQAILPLEGSSLVPGFEKDVETKRTLYWEHLGRKAVRRGKYKMITSDKGDNAPAELYDMEADRTETENIADQYPEIAKELLNDWEVWAERTAAKPWPWDEK